MKSIINALKKEGKQPALPFYTFQIRRFGFGRLEFAQNLHGQLQVNVEQFSVASLRKVHMHCLFLCEKVLSII